MLKELNKERNKFKAALIALINDFEARVGAEVFMNQATIVRRYNGSDHANGKVIDITLDLRL